MDKLLTRNCDWLRKQKSRRIRLEAFQAWIEFQIARATQGSPADG